MKRRSHGVNLDDGVALSTQEEFDRLYVAARPEEVERLGDWLSTPGADAIVLAGQIGTGKTTLLNDLLRSSSDFGIVRLEFDRTPLEETQGAFLAVLFGSLLQEALTLECSCDGLGITLSDFAEPAPADWGTLCDLLLKAPGSMVDAARIRGIYRVFGENAVHSRKACAMLIERMDAEMGRALTVIAEGVDKFHISRAGYLGLVEVLDFLSDYKTLYEANAIHFFDSGRKWVSSDRHFIGPLSDENLVEMYAKRLGSYAPLYRQAFPSLLALAGGNARQAMRLLNGYYFQRSRGSNDRGAALAITAHRVAQDLLQFGFEKFRADMLVVFKRDGYVEAGVLARPATARDAGDIVYRNWALLTSSPPPGGTRWPLIVNPLVSDALVWEPTAPEPPELVAARRWARDHQMSPMGMGIPEDEEGKPVAWERVWKELSSSESSQDELNVVGLLEEVASSLFSENRQDRIFVSYRDPTNLNIALDYLIGKATTYGPFTCRELRIAGGETEDPISELIRQTVEVDDATIFSVFMAGTWTAGQLEALDRLRDRMADIQMLWFAEHSALLRYLPHWPQFRQFFRFYVLEDDFLAALTQADIEDDLAVLEDLGGNHEDGVQRLRHVLEHLHATGR